MIDLLLDATKINPLIRNADLFSHPDFPCINLSWATTSGSIQINKCLSAKNAIASTIKAPGNK